MSHRLPLVAVAFLAAMPALGQPLGTAFTYQGRLVDGGTPASGAFDLQLILFDDPAGGSQVGPILTLGEVVVTEGLFVVSLDFGAVFSGNRRWLQIGVRPGPSTGAYAILSPRQELTAAPAALFSTTTPWGGVAAKPPGFADDVDNDVLGGLSCATGQIPKFNVVGGWICAADANTTYTQGTGISITGTTIGIATGGVTSALILDGTIAAADLAPNSVTDTQIATDAVGASEIAANAVGASEIAIDAVGAAEIVAGAVGASEIAADAVGPRRSPTVRSRWST